MTVHSNRHPIDQGTFPQYRHVGQGMEPIGFDLTEPIVRAPDEHQQRILDIFGGNQQKNDIPGYYADPEQIVRLATGIIADAQAHPQDADKLLVPGHPDLDVINATLKNLEKAIVVTERFSPAQRTWSRFVHNCLRAHRLDRDLGRSTVVELPSMTYSKRSSHDGNFDMLHRLKGASVAVNIVSYEMLDRIYLASNITESRVALNRRPYSNSTIGPNAVNSAFMLVTEEYLDEQAKIRFRNTITQRSEGCVVDFESLPKVQKAQEKKSFWKFRQK